MKDIDFMAPANTAASQQGGFTLDAGKIVRGEIKGVLPDTGARTKFETGAVRDASENKGWPHAIPPTAIRKMALRFEQGGKKYARNNWMKGIPLSRYQDALMRHTMAWAEGQTDEDHLGAVLWNAACAAWTEEQIQKGKLPAELNDLPFRE